MPTDVAQARDKAKIMLGAVADVMNPVEAARDSGMMPPGVPG